MSDNLQNRRSFITSILTLGAAGLSASIIYPIIKYLTPPKQREAEVSNVSAGKIKDMENDSYKIVRFGNKPVILIKTDKGDFKALSAQCTHLDCTVQYKKSEGVIWCACHNGKYDLNGRNISGPPPRPLDPYIVQIKGEEVFISKKA
jgi:Rieske Fe-S protein